MYLVGPGDFNLIDSLPPGSDAIQLETAPSGHLVVPCGYYSEYDAENARGGLEIERTIALQATTGPRNPNKNPESPDHTSELFGSWSEEFPTSPAPSTDSNRVPEDTMHNLSREREFREGQAASSSMEQ